MAIQPDDDLHSAAFWEGLRRREVVVGRCLDCRRNFFPHLPSCPRCGGRRLADQVTAGSGTVYSWFRGRPGVSYTPFTKESDRSVLDLAAEACSSALDDAGMAASEVDGIASFMVMHDSVPGQAVATCLAIPELKVALDIDL